MSTPRFICAEIFADRNQRLFRVSFRIAEEGTWDHRFEDLAGHEIDPDALWLGHDELIAVQTACDQAAVRHSQHAPVRVPAPRALPMIESALIESAAI